jgi:hypothetical protein
MISSDYKYSTMMCLNLSNHADFIISIVWVIKKRETVLCEWVYIYLFVCVCVNNIKQQINMSGCSCDEPMREVYQARKGLFQKTRF